MPYMAICKTILSVRLLLQNQDSRLLDRTFLLCPCTLEMRFVTAHLIRTRKGCLDAAFKRRHRTNQAESKHHANHWLLLSLQIIQDQSDVVNSLWQVLEATGLDHAQIIQVAAENGITIDDNGCPGQVPNIRPGANRMSKDGAGGQIRPKMRLDMLQIIPPEQYRASVLGDNAARDAAAPVAGQSAVAHAEGGYLAAFQNGVNANPKGGYAQSHAQNSAALGDHHASPPRSKSPLPSPRPASSPSVSVQPLSAIASGLNSSYPGSLGKLDNDLTQKVRTGSLCYRKSR